MNKVKHGLMRVLGLVGIVDSSTLTKNNSNAAISLNVKRMVVSGNDRANVPMSFPYGYMSLPPQNTRIVVTNFGTTGQSPVAIGTLSSLSANNPVSIVAGEGFNYSDNWVIKYGNIGVTAYKIDDAAYSATLPSGEWFIKFIQDLINDNNTTLRDYINAQIAAKFNSHVHTGVMTGGGTSGAPNITITDIAQNSTLQDDYNYATDENCLLNDNATVIP